MLTTWSVEKGVEEEAWVLQSLLHFSETLIVSL